MSTMAPSRQGSKDPCLQGNAAYFRARARQARLTARAYSLLALAGVARLRALMADPLCTEEERWGRAWFLANTVSTYREAARQERALAKEREGHHARAAAREGALVSHWGYAGAPFCRTTGTKATLLLVEDESDVTCKRCLHLIGIQASPGGGGP